jgi:hypothetical protein
MAGTQDRSTREEIARLTDRLAADVLLREYLRRAEEAQRRGASELDPVRTVGQVLGERMALVVNLLTDADYATYPDRPLTPEQRLSLARRILAAVPFLWLNDVFTLSIASPLPRHVIDREILPFERMWWTFEGYSGIVGAPLDGLRVDAVLIEATPEGAVLTNLGSTSTKAAISVETVPFGSVYPNDFAKPEGVRQFLSALSFLNSPYIPKEERKLASHERRWVERESRGRDEPSLEQVVRFVDLRQPTTDREVVGPSSKREWAHKWVVRGHHRAQWYPSRGAHQVIWIAPYVKGPLEKALATPAYRVIR